APLQARDRFLVVLREVLEERLEEGPELAALGREPAEGVAFDQPGEEALREVLGVLDGLSAPGPQGAVRGLPVAAAEPLERLLAVRPVQPPDDVPDRIRKVPAGTAQAGLGRAHCSSI